jgi:hypothetical protein
MSASASENSLISISEANLLHGRQGRIRQMLRPLRKGNKDVACKAYRGPAGRGVVLGAHDGNVGLLSYRDWRFLTRATYVRCRYYELWQPILKAETKFFLQEAYLDMYIVESAFVVPKELVSVHCEPLGDRHKSPERYKCGPHIHLHQAYAPFPRCHLALNLSHLDAILESEHSLTVALENAIALVNDEVLSRV